MKRSIAAALAALALILPAAGGAAAAVKPQDKEVKPLVVASITDPEGQNDGLLRAAYENGILRLDYDPLLAGTATLSVAFQDGDGSSLPGEGRLMILRGASADDLIDPAQNDQAVQGEAIDLPIQVDPRIKGLNFKFEAESAFYESPRIPVLWRAVSQSAPYAIESIWPGQKIALGVGQSVDVRVNLAGRYSDARLSLTAEGYGLKVAAVDMTLTGIAAGSQSVSLKNADGVPLEILDVQVMPFYVDHGQPPEPTKPAFTLYRVLAPTIDVFDAPDNTQRRIGTLRQFQLVGVVSLHGGWAELSNGTWVLDKYLLPL